MEGVTLEFRKAWHDLTKMKIDWQNLGRRSLPLVAASALSTGALILWKQQVPPKGDLLAASCTFRCTADSRLSGSVVEQLREAGAGAAEVAALRRAAQRLRGPIERDLMRAQLEAEKLQDKRHLYVQLVEEWRQAGFFQEPLEAKRPRAANVGIDLVTQIDESYGRDIGSEVPLCLLEEKAGSDPASVRRSLTPEEWQAAADALEVHGVAILKGMLTLKEVGELRGQVHLHSSAMDIARSRGPPEAVPVREFKAEALQAEDEELEPYMSAPGRQHYYLRGRVFEEAVQAAQRAAMPLVWEVLCRQHAAAGYPLTKRPYVSEVQLMTSDPCAVDQFWHMDNIAPGLTLVVPLTAVPEDMGATLLLPGSHHCVGQEQGVVSKARAFLRSMLSANSRPAVTLELGDALLYDSRLLHRTAANRRYDRMAAVLVFRYDYDRPPGIGLLASQLYSWWGNALSGFHRFYCRLPGPVDAS
ncbi:unnamed protein product [Symbiodinium natans]|uniref:Uncharacterized protein n=1 Tax=Symbiodinium natans TaxID=878477 RepID=A0A812QPP3_9DINO|nr:unnamed protein product [Symbiodinium natans]